MHPPPFASAVLCAFALALLPACSSPEVDCVNTPATPPVVPAAVVTRPVVVVPAAVVTRAVTAPAGFTQDVTITSDPAGVTVSIDGNDVGVTPLVATLDLSRTYAVTLTKPGYEPADFPIKPVISTVGSSGVKNGGASVGGTFSKFPSKYNMVMVPAADPMREFEAAVVDLDKQRASGQITPDQYAQRVDELKKQYSQK